MNLDALRSLQQATSAHRVALIIPVVRGDTMILGGRFTVTATASGGFDGDPMLGRPLTDVFRQPSREALVERYHFDGGGVLGTASSAAPYKCGDGLRELDTPHLLAPDLPDVPPNNLGCWLVLDDVALGFVSVSNPRITDSERRRALPVLGQLRRLLARAPSAQTKALSSTGLIVHDDAGVRGADPRGTRWLDGRPAAALRPGLSDNALVLDEPLGGDNPVHVARVRPVRRPVAPLGLRLTPSEREVARYLASSATLSEIAANRGCRTSTVQRHRDHIYAALSAATRVEITQLVRAI